jgi:tripartite ATP-independent transporter DctP family solute receptor
MIKLVHGFLYALLLMPIAGSALAQQYTFNIGHVLDPQHPLHIGGLKMAEAISKKSNGRVKMNIYPSSQLGDAREMIQNVQSGTIVGILDSTTKLVPFVPEFAALDMPYLVKPDKALALLETPVVRQEIGDKAAAAGFRIVDYWEVTFRSIYSRRQINAMADLKGMKLYTSPSPAFITILRAFGASPANMAFAELYTALQQGMMDGADNDPLTFLTTRHFEVAKNLALTDHAMRLNAFIMSEKAWQALPDDIKQLIRDASLEGQEAMRAYRTARESTVLADLKARGVTITEPDLKPFIAAGQSTYPEFEKTAGADLVAHLNAALGK